MSVNLVLYKNAMLDIVKKRLGSYSIKDAIFFSKSGDFRFVVTIKTASGAEKGSITFENFSVTVTGALKSEEKNLDEDFKSFLFQDKELEQEYYDMLESQSKKQEKKLLEKDSLIQNPPKATKTAKEFKNKVKEASPTVKLENANGYKILIGSEFKHGIHFILAHNPYNRKNRSIKRGYIYYVDLNITPVGEMSGCRPCLVLQYDESSQSAFIIPMSSKTSSEDYPVLMVVDSNDIAFSRTFKTPEKFDDGSKLCFPAARSKTKSAIRECVGKLSEEKFKEAMKKFTLYLNNQYDSPIKKHRKKDSESE